MSITANQIKTIHVAAKAVGFNDAQYRTLLRNIANVETCKQLDQVSFEDCMAVLEDLGFQDRVMVGGKPYPTYWRDKVSRRGTACGDRQVFKIRQLEKQCRYGLGGLCMRFSDGRTTIVEKLKPAEAWKLIECMKEIALRQEAETSEQRVSEAVAASNSIPQFDAFTAPVTDEEVPF